MTQEVTGEAEVAAEPERHNRESDEDEDLIEAVLAGDGIAFEIIMRRHNRLMFRAARAILRNEADAEDAVQEAYLKAYVNLQGFSRKARLSTWLCKIAVNESLGRLRRRIPSSPLGDSVEGTMATRSHQLAATSWMADTVSPEAAAARGQLRRLVEKAIDDLPRAQQAVFMLRAVEGFSTEDTAECLTIPPETVKTRLHRARKRLRASLSRDCESALTDAFPFAGTRCDRVVAQVLRRLKEIPASG